MGSISFDNALGVHERALHLRTQRAAVLANNITNADTPGFKARDFDFRQVLASAKSESSQLAMKTTQAGHLAAATGGIAGGIDMQYRIPLQPSLDGNTVDEQFESAAFARNALEFGASFRFLNGKFKSMKLAISGK